MANQKAVRFEITSGKGLIDAVNSLTQKGNDIVQVIGTKTNAYGILIEGVIIYKKRGTFYF